MRVPSYLAGGIRLSGECHKRAGIEVIFNTKLDRHFCHSRRVTIITCRKRTETNNEPILTRIPFLLACLTLWVPPLAGHAQAAPTLAELEIDFWPEYDQPAMLVIYRGTLTADAP